MEASISHANKSKMTSHRSNAIKYKSKRVRRYMYKDDNAAGHALEENESKDDDAASHALEGDESKDDDAASHALEEDESKDDNAASHTSEEDESKDDNAAGHALEEDEDDDIFCIDQIDIQLLSEQDEQMKINREEFLTKLVDDPNISVRALIRFKYTLGAKKEAFVSKLYEVLNVYETEDIKQESDIKDFIQLLYNVFPFILGEMTTKDTFDYQDITSLHTMILDYYSKEYVVESKRHYIAERDPKHNLVIGRMDIRDAFYPQENSPEYIGACWTKATNDCPHSITIKRYYLIENDESYKSSDQETALRVAKYSDNEQYFIVKNGANILAVFSFNRSEPTHIKLYMLSTQNSLRIMKSIVKFYLDKGIKAIIVITEVRTEYSNRYEYIIIDCNRFKRHIDNGNGLAGIYMYVSNPYVKDMIGLKYVDACCTSSHSFFSMQALFSSLVTYKLVERDQQLLKYLFQKEQRYLKKMLPSSAFTPSSQEEHNDSKVDIEEVPILPSPSSASQKEPISPSSPSSVFTPSSQEEHNDSKVDIEEAPLLPSPSSASQEEPISPSSPSSAFTPSSQEEHNDSKVDIEEVPLLPSPSSASQKEPISPSSPSSTFTPSSQEEHNDSKVDIEEAPLSPSPSSASQKEPISPSSPSSTFTPSSQEEHNDSKVDIEEAPLLPSPSPSSSSQEEHKAVIAGDSSDDDKEHTVNHKYRDYLDHWHKFYDNYIDSLGSVGLEYAKFFEQAKKNKNYECFNVHHLVYPYLCCYALYNEDCYISRAQVAFILAHHPTMCFSDIETLLDEVFSGDSVINEGEVNKEQSKISKKGRLKISKDRFKEMLYKKLLFDDTGLSQVELGTIEEPEAPSALQSIPDEDEGYHSIPDNLLKETSHESGYNSRTNSVEDGQEGGKANTLLRNVASCMGLGGLGLLEHPEEPLTNLYRTRSCDGLQSDQCDYRRLGRFYTDRPCYRGFSLSSKYFRENDLTTYDSEGMIPVNEPMM